MAEYPGPLMRTEAPNYDVDNDGIIDGAAMVTNDLQSGYGVAELDAMGFPMAGGRYYGPSLAGPITTGTPVSSLLLYQPIFVGNTTNSVTRLGVYMDVAQSAGGKCRVGLYSSSSGKPSSRLADSGEIDTTTTGIREAVVAVGVTRNTWYWLAYVTNSSSGTIKMCNSLIMANRLGFATVPQLVTAYYEVHVFAALPSTASGSLTAATTNVPYPFALI